MDITVSISPDKMSASIVIKNKPPDEKITHEKILEALKNAGVVHGTIYDAIGSIVESQIVEQEIILAKGTEPIHGLDGRILMKVEQKKGTAVGKNIDFREFPTTKRIIVRKGQEIAEILPPTEGTPGRNVLGEEIPAKPGKEAKVNLVKNVSISGDGKTIVATADGILKIDLQNNSIEVSEYLEIEGNVDYSSGNIDFPGVVLVKGDVKPGFIVRAKGDIEIQGVAEAATLVSLEGSVKVSGVKGREKGLVKAKKDIHCKYAESATLEAENVLFENQLVNCNVRANNSVIGSGRNSTIVGGEIVASFVIEAEVIGSDLGVNTYLEVGTNPFIREELKLLQTQIEIDKNSVSKLLSIVKQYKELKEKGVKIPPEREEQFSKAARTLISVREQLERNINRLNELEKKIREMQFDAKIIARKIVFSGVEIVINRTRYYVDREIPKAVFKSDGEKILLGGYGAQI